MKPLRLMVAGLLTLAASGAALAAPASSGLSGQLEIPTADVIDHNTLSVVIAGERGQVGGGVDFGVYPGVEVGAQVHPHAGSTSQLAPFGKLRLLAESSQAPSVAVGLDDAAVFGVASKAISPNMRLSLGYGNGWINGLFAGVSMALNPVTIQGASGLPKPSTTLMFEYVAQRVDAGVRLTFAPGLNIDLGLQSDVGAKGFGNIGFIGGASFTTAL